MTTPADILNQLQRAWASTAVATVRATTNEPTNQQPPQEPKQFAGVLLTGKTEPCQGHPQPLVMIDEPDKSRPGFIRSKCRHCGKFLGYRRDS